MGNVKFAKSPFFHGVKLRKHDMVVRLLELLISSRGFVLFYGFAYEFFKVQYVWI